MALYAQPQASHLAAADQSEGPSVDDVVELCQEFGFHFDSDDIVNLSILRDVITAAIERWPLTTEPVADPLQSEALLEIRPTDAPVPQETVFLDKRSGLMAFGMGRLGAFPAPQQSAAPPAVDISDKAVAGIRDVVLGLARSASPDTLPAVQLVNLAELHDPDFSDGLTPSQHLDVVHGGADPRVATASAPRPLERLSIGKLVSERIQELLDEVAQRGLEPSSVILGIRAEELLRKEVRKSLLFQRNANQDNPLPLPNVQDQLFVYGVQINKSDVEAAEYVGIECQ
jgi:hypothetical protein